MRIYGDSSFLTDKPGIKNLSQMKLSQGNTKLAEFADRFIEEHRAVSKDQATVSKEGMAYIKEQLSVMETERESAAPDAGNLTQITRKEIPPTDELYADYIVLNSDVVDEDGVSRNLYLDLNCQYLHEMAGKENPDWEGHMEGLAKTYAAVRKKITEGHENGTREVWVRDDSTDEDFNGVELEIDGQAVRYRRLTREEEIDYLDKAADRFTENVAEWYVKEEKTKRAEEAKREAANEEREANKEWYDFEKIVDRLVDEARTLLDKVREEIAKIEKMFQKELDIEGRMEMEASEYRAETVARGKKQAQYENYKKINQMISDVMVLRGNIRA